VVGEWSFVIGLTLIGLSLIMLELFVIPGFGVAGILGLLGVLGAVWYASFNIGAWVGAAVFGVSLVLSLVAVMKATAGQSLTMLRNKQILPGKIVSREEAESRDEKTSRGLPPIGAEGVAVTMLRPAGIVRIGDRRYDVIADGPIVEPGAAVTVVEIIGNVIKVRAV
jgi:membrane-bound serine protease (ClpP class)